MVFEKFCITTRTKKTYFLLRKVSLFLYLNLWYSVLKSFYIMSIAFWAILKLCNYWLRVFKACLVECNRLKSYN